MEYQLLKAHSDDLGRLQDQLNSLAIEGWRVFSMVIEPLETRSQSSFPSSANGSALIVLLERSQQERAYSPSSSK
jgi:hypothetical protein